MVKSVEKRHSKKVDFDFLYFIYTCIRKNSGFALNLTFSNSIEKTTFDNTRKLSNR